MTSRKTTKKKPKKPRKSFPLYAHACGQWAKTIGGEKHYFGPWDDPEGAERRYDALKKSTRQGRPRKTDTESITLAEVLNDYLAHKAESIKRSSSDIAILRFNQDLQFCTLTAKAIGRNKAVSEIGPDDFAKLRKQLDKTLKTPSSLQTAISKVKAAFNWAKRNQLISTDPVYGDAFVPPGIKEIKKHRNIKKQETGGRVFTSQQCLQILKHSRPFLKAAVYLGLNCGYGNNDCNSVKFSNLDLESGWANFPRPKTGEERICKLWPETVQAIKDWIEVRPKPKNEKDSEYVFLTSRGTRCIKVTPNKQARNDTIAKNLDSVLLKLDIKREGLSFYSLRHTHRTWSDSARDPVAANLIMGHTDSHMSAVYRDDVSRRRLFEVAKHVRLKLFRSKKTKTKKKKPAR